MHTHAIEDELTIFTAAEQKERLLAFLLMADELELDLSKVEEMDSAGLQLLILLKREAKAAGKHLRFVMHSKVVLEVLELANLIATFGDQVILAQHEG